MSAPFIIWTMQRTGGTSLTDLLMQISEHPSAEHEPFNWAKKKPRQFWPITEAWNNHKNEAQLTQSLNEIFAQGVLIKHCYELHGMTFNLHLMNAAVKAGYRHIVLQRRNEYARLISKFVAEGHGTWFPDYANKVFKEVARGDRELEPVPVERVLAHFRHCREFTGSILAALKTSGAAYHEIAYEDLYVGEPEPRIARLKALIGFLGFDAAELASHDAAMRETLFEKGQNTSAIAGHLPNLRKVDAALARAGCPGAPPLEPAAEPAAPAEAGKPHLKIAQEFHRLAVKHGARGPYLEIGVGAPARAALLTQEFAGQTRHAIGFAGRPADAAGVEFHAGHPNDMRKTFEDGQFATVFWNAALTSDPQFWRTLEEIRRVLAPGGLLVVCAADFSRSAASNGIKAVGPKGNPIAHSTVTLAVHAHVGDYWRISPQAMRKTVLAGCEILEVHEVMTPSRVFGVGLRPTAA